jgi:GH15 family glucan-1,4-alpha-glucosidase
MKKYQPIENYGVIGDLHTVALAGMDGSIDFMCFPAFDSPSVFAALLDRRKGGYFKLAPRLADVRQKQIYLPDTNILLSRFLSEEGVAEISDFMPVEEEHHGHRVVRRAKTVRGEVNYRMTFAPKFDYARCGHKIEKHEKGLLFVSEGGDKTVLMLRSSVPVRTENGEARAEFSLRAGENATFILEEHSTAGQSPADREGYAAQAFKDTVNFWRAWVARSTYKGRWREMVNRSALILKLLTSKPHGSTVAAATFGLPERIGGERNWDYRYTWIRDASFTLYGLIRLGYTQEAGAFMKWVEKRCEELTPDGALQTMYGIDGRSELPETILSHLEGYEESSPVRIGNAAYQQLQLDIYGELIDSVYLYDKYGEPLSYDLWQELVRLVEWISLNWGRKDDGIWEVRGGAHEFLHSRLMCWVAMDRAIRLSQKRSFPAPVEKWRTIRDRIYHEIYHGFWNQDIGAFVQSKGSTTLDASCLLMPLMRSISPRDPRWISTLKMIQQELVSDSLVYRYNVADAAADGLTGSEGTFCMCSFWNVECISRSGDLPKARFLFEKMLGYANHLGLYAEELGPRAEHLGNFPQAFTHLALISAAYDLNRRLGD